LDLRDRFDLLLRLDRRELPDLLLRPARPERFEREEGFDRLFRREPLELLLLPELLVLLFEDGSWYKKISSPTEANASTAS
jgi:hypothetical protein